jgi:DNA-binding MarR family transcriptional regulator
MVRPLHGTALRGRAVTVPGASGHDHFAKAWSSITIEPKYVNMADLNITLPPAPAARPTDSPAGAEEPIWDIIELLFFAYRDFVGDPDHVLAKFGFGRAHHRVLHFINRNPGIKVADLLVILKITKQSLGRVLKQLVDEGYVVQQEGANDRRQRLLFVTAKGEALALKLAGLQTTRIARAIAEVGPGAHEAARRFLAGMIDAADRDEVFRLIARADRGRTQR